MEFEGKKHFFCYLFCTSLGCHYLCRRNSKTSMKQLAVIIGLLLLLVSSCTGDKEGRAVLERADAVMEAHPDSAYEELQSLLGNDSVSPSLGGVRGGPRTILLLAESENKLDKQMPSDTVFQEVVDYYERHGNANERMKAYYLMGCIYRDMHEAPMALQWYLDATEQADTLSPDCNYWTLTKIYGQMAGIYHSQLMPLEEIESRRQFSKYAEKAGNTYQTIRGVEKQLEAYQMIGDTAMILALTDSVHDLYLQADMPQAAASVYPTAIYIYLARKDYRKAKELMDIYETQSGLFDAEGNISKTREGYYCFKGMYYQGINKHDSAKYYYHKLLQYGLDMSSYNGLFSVYWKEQNMDSVAKYSLLYRQALKDNAKTQQQEAMVMVKAMYDYNRQQKIANEKEIELIRRTNLLIYIIIGVAILLVLLSVWYIRRNRAGKEALRKKEQLYADTLHSAKVLLARKEKELEELSQQNQFLGERQRQLHQEIADAKSRIKALESSTPFQEMLPHNQEDAMLANPIVGMFHHFAVNPVQHHKLIPENWDELDQLMEHSLPRLYAMIVNNDFLNTEQKRMVFLVRLHFKNNEIMNLLNLGSPQRVTNRIAKLNQLLYGRRGAKNFYDNLKNMLPKY